MQDTELKPGDRVLEDGQDPWTVADLSTFSRDELLAAIMRYFGEDCVGLRNGDRVLMQSPDRLERVS